MNTRLLEHLAIRAVPMHLHELAQETGYSVQDVKVRLERLEAEGLILNTDGLYHLPEKPEMELPEAQRMGPSTRIPQSIWDRLNR